MHEASERGLSTPPGEPSGIIEAELARERARTREVDHRAKNSLQLVTSLLLLQSRRSVHEETRRVLTAMHQRVSALAAVHRDFMDAPHPDRFDLTRFVREQVAALAQQREAGTVRLELEPVEVDAAAAPALALILNELTVNALAHAAADGREPRVTLGLQKANGGFKLSVEDDGPGLSPASAGAGFGLTMVRLLAQQLNARFTLEDAQPGLRAVVTTA